MFKHLGLRALRGATPICRASLAHPKLTASHHIDSVGVPYSGILRCHAIIRCFSSAQVDRRDDFRGRHQQDSKGGGRTGAGSTGRDSMDYDVLITDVNHETLKTAIAKQLGVPYLSEATEADAREVVCACTGFFYGQKFRPIVPFAVGLKGEARWVYFVLDGCSPLTYLSAQTSKLLNIREGHPTLVTIGGHSKEVRMSPPNSRFSDINILGADFCFLHNVSLMYDYRNLKVKMVFGGTWDLLIRSRR
ncbi:unnamed protein product [Tuber aestivum]|uniref:Uncharacterized protein n=1 Tax=Tuber aestivum TaxID=59557 RepID=A0A292Q5M7_9PEZI|nr:unnamed protein product [Tuber aestivum]